MQAIGKASLVLDKIEKVQQSTEQGANHVISEIHAEIAPQIGVKRMRNEWAQ